MSVVCNILLLIVCYTVCRVAFLLENWSMFASCLSTSVVGKMAWGGLVFDLAAIFYTNALWLLLVLLPLHCKETGWWRSATKWLFLVVNGVCLAANLADCVYFPFGMHRATALIFSEFGGENNLGTIAGVEVVRHWYLTLLFLLMAFGLWKLYQHHETKQKPLLKYYLKQTAGLIVAVAVAVVCIRGGATTAIRPLTVSNAHQYVEQPLQTAIVLNTPFSIIRTVGKASVKIEKWFDEEKLAQLYSPLHIPVVNANEEGLGLDNIGEDCNIDSIGESLECHATLDNFVPEKRNIVVLIVESFAQEFIGALNRDLDGGTYRGYTEFVDSLLPHCLTFENTFCSGTVSIDAIPSILASIPRMKHAFMLTPYSLNHITGLAGELRDWGYETAFFHGAENSSMGFQAFARSAGFQQYFGRTEYCQDPRFDGDNDFDGTWAIWDEPFLQYFALKMDEMQEPFCTAVFTASSHHPFALPEKYKNIYLEEGKHKLHKCIRYADNALRNFFATARTKPWYDNTIFVIVADHASSKTTHERYETEWGYYRVPILFYDPSGKLPAGMRPGVACQLDITPTLLGLVGYDRPYIAFGRDLLHGTDTVERAFNWNNVPIYTEGRYMLLFNEETWQVDKAYDYTADQLMQRPLDTRDIPDFEGMCARAKAYIQTIYERECNDQMHMSNITAPDDKPSAVQDSQNTTKQ